MESEGDLYAGMVPDEESSDGPNLTLTEAKRLLSEVTARGERAEERVEALQREVAELYMTGGIHYSAFLICIFIRLLLHVSFFFF
jgi:hypothetical protein